MNRPLSVRVRLKINGEFKVMDILGCNFFGKSSFVSELSLRIR